MNILITAIGGDIAQSIAKILRNSNFVKRIIGTDISDNHAGKFFVDEVIKIPDANDPNYLEYIKSIVNMNKINFIIPVNEKEIYNIANYIKNNESDRFNDKVIIPKTNGFFNFFDKLKTIKYLESLKLDIGLPWTVDTEETPLSFPCIFKSKETSGSKSVRKVTRDLYALHKKEFTNGVFQELLLPNDKEYTCGIYRASHSKKTFVIILHRQLKGGLTGYAKVVFEKYINNYCETIADAIELEGSINIQLIKTNNGPKLFEINPRFSSTVIFRHHLGFEDLIWSIKERLDLNFNMEFDINKVINKKFYRIYTELYE
ncbi:MAG: ATP-grasp domain-containing protein [Ignavibacteriales bacterium]|nr:ATP-grasp domain-containing protein [Ignavibacteriales bacterium]